jgi:glycosyltransferase involved in cell wall biosynthesis
VADKVVVLISGKDPVEGRGGAQHYARVHARAAVRAGFEPHTFCATARTEVVETGFGVVHRVRSSPLQLVRRDSQMEFHRSFIPVHAPVVAGSVERFLLRRNAPCLIHGFSTWGYIGVLASRWLRRRGVDAPALTGFYTTADHETRAKMRSVGPGHGRFHRVRYGIDHAWNRTVVAHYERQAYVRSRLVTVNYESVRRLLLETYGTGAPIRKLPYTSEAAFLRSQGTEPAPLPEAAARLAPRDAPLIVSVSRHDPRKGVDVLLQALAIVRGRGVPYRACLVSGGPLLAPHRQMTAQLRIDDVTAITDWVADPYVYLQHADVFVLPSLEEASGSLALLEALHAGVAVVASNIDGIPEDVADGDSALLVPPGDASALAEAIIRVVTDPVTRQRLARRGRKTFVERFSADAFASALRETYAEVLA